MFAVVAEGREPDSVWTVYVDARERAAALSKDGPGVTVITYELDEAP